MQLLDTIGDMIWVAVWIAFALSIVVSIVCAGIFIVAKLVEFIKETIL